MAADGVGAREGGFDGGAVGALDVDEVAGEADGVAAAEVADLAEDGWGGGDDVVVGGVGIDIFAAEADAVGVAENG